MKIYLEYLLPCLVAFALSAILTPLVRRLAICTGQVARPREDRWHTKPTALLGGVGIVASFYLATALAFLVWPSPDILREYLPLLLCAFLMFLVGLVDDVYHISPQNKLVCQVVITATLVFFGFKIDWFVSYTFNTFFTVFWIVAISNAFNLLDNMDGLAAGIALISSLFLTIIIIVTSGLGSTGGLLIVVAIFLGSLLGFLLYNFQPASIFMGDCGSLFIGFMLAGITTHQRIFHSSHFLPIILIPVLILFIPILDTGFVSIMRTLFGRSVAQGGKDHSSHRLVEIGLPERKAVLTLYGFSSLGGVVALVGVLNRPLYFFSLLVVFLLTSLFFWIYLARVRVYPEEERTIIEKSKKLTTVWISFTYKRSILEVLLDVFLVSFGYWFSYFLRFEGTGYVDNFPLFLKSLPIVLACSILAYFAFGVYQSVWRYISVADLIIYVRAVTVAVVFSILILLFLYRFQGYSRTVFGIFWGISLFFLAGSRLSFRMIGESLRRNAVANGLRVLIYGAGDKGEFALREILNNRKLGLTPVGFIDDDVKKQKRKIQGYKVLGGRNELEEVVAKHRVKEIIVASGNIHPENLKAVCQVCDRMGVAVRNLELSIK